MLLTHKMCGACVRACILSSSSPFPSRPFPPLPLPRLSYPSTTKDKFTADYHQKVVLRFSLTSATTHIPVTVHQAFVRLVRSGSQQEVFFIAEQDKQGGGHTFEMVRDTCTRVPTLRREREAVCCDWTEADRRAASATSISLTAELVFPRQLAWGPSLSPPSSPHLQDVSKAGKDSFNSESGDYVMSLLIGDFAVEQPLEWNIVSEAV